MPDDPEPPAPGPEVVIDLGDDHVPVPGRAETGPETTLADNGFTFGVPDKTGAQYTVRLIRGRGVQAHRPQVQALVDDLNRILGPYFVLDPGLAPEPADIANFTPPPFQLRIVVSSESRCGSGSIGCGGVAQGRFIDGKHVWTAGRVWLHPDLANYGANIRQEVIHHEVGHALGLGHYNNQYQGKYQVMRSFVDSTATGEYRRGDRNGLLAARGRPPGHDNIASAAAISVGQLRPAKTWFATAKGGTGQPELRSKYGNASNRSVWFKYVADPADYGRVLVARTSNDGVDDFNTVIGRVVNGRIVAGNNDSGGTKLSALTYKPTVNNRVHHFVVDGMYRKRGITHLHLARSTV